MSIDMLPSPEKARNYNVIPGPLGLDSASLHGKVALVTGAGRGIGREVALELARRGACVVINYANSHASAEETASLIRKLHYQSSSHLSTDSNNKINRTETTEDTKITNSAEPISDTAKATSGTEATNGTDTTSLPNSSLPAAITVQANVSKVEDIVHLFDRAIAVYGKLDIVFSNSGVVSFGHIKDVTPEEFDRVFAINTRGQFFVAREAYRRLERGGRLILMGSITGQAKAVPRHAVYSGSKGAIEAFVRCLAVDFGDKQITVNAVAPGGIKTDMYHAVCREYIPQGEELNNEEVDEYAAGWSPIHRVGLPIDIARVVCFLASQDGEWMNGKVLGVDGGACM